MGELRCAQFIFSRSFFHCDRVVILAQEQPVLFLCSVQVHGLFRYLSFVQVSTISKSTFCFRRREQGGQQRALENLVSLLLPVEEPARSETNCHRVVQIWGCNICMK